MYTNAATTTTPATTPTLIPALLPADKSFDALCVVFRLSSENRLAIATFDDVGAVVLEEPLTLLPPDGANGVTVVDELPPVLTVLLGVVVDADDEEVVSGAGVVDSANVP